MISEFDRLVDDVRAAVETRSDVVYDGNLPGSPKWERIPYSAELERAWGDPQIYGVGVSIGYRVRLGEFGKKPRETTFGVRDEDVGTQVIALINGHLNGPRDLS